MRFSFERLEQPPGHRQGVGIESGADVRGEAQLPAFPVAHEKGTERGPRALARGVAANHEIRRMGSLYLEPRARSPARFVGAALALADHALEAVRHRGLVQGDSVLLGMYQPHE